jgi:predicted RecA/RadA family phage recombinase
MLTRRDAASPLAPKFCSLFAIAVGLAILLPGRPAATAPLIPVAPLPTPHIQIERNPIEQIRAVARRGGAVRGPRGGAVVHRGGAAVGPRGAAYRGRTVAVGPRGNVAVRSTTAAGRRGGWARPGWYRWPAGGAVAAGAAIGFVSAATAAAWAGAAPAPGMCWYYTDPSRRQGFWDYCR